MTKADKSENLLPFDVIVRASAGNTSALCQVVEHYDNYIATLCTRVLCDEYGNTYSYVDENMQNRLRLRLIARTLMFCTER